MVKELQKQNLSVDTIFTNSNIVSQSQSEPHLQTDGQGQQELYRAG